MSAFVTVVAAELSSPASSSFTPPVSRIPHRRVSYSAPARPARSQRAMVSMDAHQNSSDPTTLSSIPFSPSSSALLQGIRAVAVGKLGSKPVPPEVIAPIFEELSMASAAPPDAKSLDLHLLRASFLGSLYVKAELTDDERFLLAYASGRQDRLYTAAEVLAAADAGALAKGTPLETFALRVMDGERLSVKEAEDLGRLLYGVDEGPVGCRPVKALIAHVMRVRHETDEELSGLARAAKATLRKDWFDDVGACERQFALIAEPFDGTITADLLTPVVCQRLREYGFSPVMAVGESSGPKYGPNLRDVTKLLDIPFCENGREVAEKTGQFGVAVDQQVCSPGLAGWTRTRRTILKRPSIATTEKYVDVCPGGARLFVGSAFHSAYVGKMASAAEAVGFDAYIIVGKGKEGTVGLGVGEKRDATLLTGWRLGKGYAREEVSYNALRDWDGDVVGEDQAPERGSATAETTARRIQRFAEEGSSGNGMFDARARVTIKAFDKALAVLAREVPDVVSVVSKK